MASINDNGNLAEMIAAMEDRMKSEGDVVDRRGSGRESIVGGMTVSEMSFDEQWKLFAPSRSKGSLVIDNDSSDQGGTNDDAHLGGEEVIVSHSSPSIKFANPPWIGTRYGSRANSRRPPSWILPLDRTS